jgi:ribosomal protein S12 methylthiotransferase
VSEEPGRLRQIGGLLTAQTATAADGPRTADLVVVNTCAFIDAARQESIDTILDLADRRAGSRLVVTGCMAERYGDELAEALPEVDLVAGFGVPVTLRRKNAVRPAQPAPSGGHAGSPWAYIKVAEGCDRRCGFCAIPSFRGKQRSRSTDVLLDEVDAWATGSVKSSSSLRTWLRGGSIGRPGPGGPTAGPAAAHRRTHRAVAARVERVRLLYLYPSALDDELVDSIVATGVPYFDLSLQHVSRPLVERMRRWGEGERFLRKASADIRAAEPPTPGFGPPSFSATRGRPSATTTRSSSS